MSHWTTIKTQIRDVQALTMAARELGLHVEQNGTGRGYYQSLKGDYVLHTGEKKGAYDIVANKLHDGTYQLVTDWHAGSVAAIVGQDFKKLVQLYGVHKTTIEARKKGMMVTRQQLPNGSIKLAIAGGAL